MPFSCVRGSVVNVVELHLHRSQSPGTRGHVVQRVENTNQHTVVD